MIAHHDKVALRLVLAIAVDKFDVSAPQVGPAAGGDFIHAGVVSGRAGDKIGVVLRDVADSLARPAGLPFLFLRRGGPLSVTVLGSILFRQQAAFGPQGMMVFSFCRIFAEISWGV